MIHVRRSCLAAAFLLAPSLLAQAPQPTLDQILARNYESRGGLARLKAVKSIRMTGKLAAGPAEFPIVVVLKRPASLRLEIDFQGNKMVQAYDGKAGWAINPFSGAKKDPEPMTADDLKDVQVQADLDGPLVDWKDKGHTVTYLGTEAVEGGDTYKLKVVLKNGTEQFLYLDTDTGLEVKSTAKRKVRESEVETETIQGDYKDEGGLMLAHSIESGAKGAPQRQKVLWQKVELDVPVADDLFRMPEKASPPTPAAAK